MSICLWPGYQPGNVALGGIEKDDDDSKNKRLNTYNTTNTVKNVSKKNLFFFQCTGTRFNVELSNDI